MADKSNIQAVTCRGMHDCEYCGWPLDDGEKGYRDRVTGTFGCDPVHVWAADDRKAERQEEKRAGMENPVLRELDEGER